MSFRKNFEDFFSFNEKVAWDKNCGEEEFK